MKKLTCLMLSMFFCLSLLSGVALAKPIAGLLFPVTGPYSAMGNDMRNGALLAIEEINAKGGVLGKPIEVIIGDDELKANIALRRYKEMVEGAGVKVIGGTLSGGISVAVNEWACKHEVLYMANCHTSMPLGSEFCGYGFVSGMIPYQTGTAVAKYAFENLGKTWMIFTQDYRYGYDQFGAFMVNSERYGGKFKGNAYIPLGTVDFSVHIPKIAAIKPDILVLNIYGQSLSAAIKQLAEMGLTKSGMKFVIPKSHVTTIVEAGSLYNENFYGGHVFYWQMQDKYPNAKNFVETYWKKFGQPPSQDSDGGYTGTRALFEAMNKAGTTTDVQKLIKTLEGYSYQYNKGPESFRACDHIRQTSVAILRGKGEKADFKKWDLAEFIGEVPAEDTLESCENNAKDLPYGKVKLPGK